MPSLSTSHLRRIVADYLNNYIEKPRIFYNVLETAQMDTDFMKNHSKFNDSVKV